MIKFFIRLAFRNLWRHSRRTILTLLSIGCGCGVILWMQAIIHGRNENMIRVITSTYVGHIQIFHPDYLGTKLPNKFFDANKVIDQLPKSSGLISTTRIHLPSLISTGEDSVPVQIEGIEPNSESLITNIKQHLKEGNFLEPDVDCEKKQIYIGRSLSKVLNVGIGEKLVVLTQAVDGTLGNELFRVEGIFESGSPDFDKLYSFIAMSCAKTLGAISGVHEIVLSAQDNNDEDDIIAEKLQSQMGGQVQVTTWREAIPSVATMIRYNEASLKLMIFVLFSVITMGVVNTLMMSVFERTKEFGVLLSIGMTPLQLRVLIFFETILLAFFGICVGTILGTLLVFYHKSVGFDLAPFFGKQSGVNGYKFDLIIYPIFLWAPYIKVIIAEFGFLILAGLYPAWKASRLSPVESLRM